MDKIYDITEEILLSLGFIKKESSEFFMESFHYFIYYIKNDIPFLISNESNECIKDNKYFIKFYNTNDGGKIIDKKTLIQQINILKNII
jgi:hypothetical protein